MGHNDGVADIEPLNEITDVKQKLVRYSFGTEMRVEGHFDFVACDLCYSARQAYKVAAVYKNLVAAKKVDGLQLKFGLLYGDGVDA